MAIKTKKALKRENRNANITALYLLEMKKDGSMKSAVVEEIARACKTSVTTVNRVVKQVQL